MDLKITKINKNQILKYLHYKGEDIPKSIDEDIKKMVDLGMKVLSPRYVYKVFDMRDPSLRPILLGRDIENLLKTSNKVVLLALTLGPRIEREIRKEFLKDMSLGLILDAVGSAGVESLASLVNKRISEQYYPEFLTKRFSPGYGDMPISVQKDLLNLLNGNKTIGLSVNEANILTPRKSITAIIGISDQAQDLTRKACKNCRLRNSCELKKRGETCEYK